ncbi:endonuclease III domain-containing protein [Gemmata sp.]|uniref:endonuclease III domain-containing protein n=1 Tax=Gemmata sp. TaxID=1914242 RepID=UPI003F70EDA4
MPAPKRPRKKPFDVTVALPLLRTATAPYPRAALFELFDEGHASVFEILVACIISIRTRDEVTLPVARALFAAARTPAGVAALSEKQIDHLIGQSTFHEPKAKTIRDIARRTVEEHGGTLPCDPDVLLDFHGVGPKCANLALGIACNLPLIGVDVHVHRVTNRWGLVAAKTPEKTMAALQGALPQANWVEINALLVPFGKHVCTGTAPKCSTCPLLAMCQQVGVTSHR